VDGDEGGGEALKVVAVEARGEEAIGEVEMEVILGDRLALGDGWKMEV
jgi:hypothetical protein